jgi:hypothetical protein
MQGEWLHEAADHRCRFPNEYALAGKVQHPRNVYLCEDAITAILDSYTDYVALISQPTRRTSAPFTGI